MFPFALCSNIGCSVFSLHQKMNKSLPKFYLHFPVTEYYYYKFQFCFWFFKKYCRKNIKKKKKKEAQWLAVEKEKVKIYYGLIQKLCWRGSKSRHWSWQKLKQFLFLIYKYLFIINTKKMKVSDLKTKDINSKINKTIDYK